MYCSACGVVVAQDLSYCNRCGAKLSGSKDDRAKPSELFPESLVWAIVSVFAVGLGCIIGLMAVMKNVLNLDIGLIIFFTLLSFLLTLTVEGVLIWLLLSRTRSFKVMTDAERPKEQATRELGAAQARALSEPVPSVIDHTTRTFEPIYNERKPE